MEIGSRQKRAESETLPELEACPFLGLEQDSSTWLAYPHPANYCHRARPLCNLSLSYQESTCLTKEHTSCPGFTQGWNGPLPAEYSGEVAAGSQIRNRLLPAAAGLALLLLLAGWLAVRQGWLPFLGGAAQATPTSLAVLLDPSQTAEALLLAPTQTASPSPTPDRSLTQTALAALSSPTRTSSPTLAFTPTPVQPTPGPALNTPFGPGEKYLLHQLAAGESMGTLVSLYNTTNRVIEASNVLVEGASIWPGTILVIVPGEKDPAAVTRFRVVQVETPTTVSQLAEDYGVSADDLRTYNSLGEADLIPAGRYLIIPAE